MNFRLTEQQIEELALKIASTPGLATKIAQILAKPKVKVKKASFPELPTGATMQNMNAVFCHDCGKWEFFPCGALRKGREWANPHPGVCLDRGYIRSRHREYYSTTRVLLKKRNFRVWG